MEGLSRSEAPRTTQRKEEGMSKGFGNLLKQAQQMQAKISQLPRGDGLQTVEASSGAEW